MPLAKLTFLHLYPDYMNFYGDAGNIMTLVRRARWRGIEVTVEKISIGDKKSLTRADFIYLGGGQSKEQQLILPDLLRRKNELSFCLANNIPMLTVCSGFQLLGRYCESAPGKKLPCLELLNYWTIAGRKRLTGRIAVQSRIKGVEKIFLGFENHAGRTFLGDDIKPWGIVLKGYGNNGKDKTEGVLFNNFIGTYLHGPLLPYNPLLADYLLKKAINVKHKNIKLPPLDNSLENNANKALLKRMGLKLRKHVNIW